MSAINALNAVAPEFCDAADVSRVLNLAASRVGPAFGAARDLATAYLAAHMLTVAQRGGSSGPVTSEREGDLAVSYAVAAGGDALQSTAYGREFAKLKAENVISAGHRMAL